MPFSEAGQVWRDMGNGWKQERSEAESLLRSLHQAYSEDENHRRWLLSRWPEWPTQLGNDVIDRQRFIPELYIRDEEDNSVQFIKDFVRGSLGLLQDEDGEGENKKDGRSEVAQVVARLSDQAVVESIPLLLPKLRRDALNSILSILSGRKRQARNRPWLLGKITQELKPLTWQSEDEAARKVLEQLLPVFRDPSGFQKVPPEQIVISASCPWSAAQSAFRQLEQLPLQCLRIMLEVLRDKPPDVMIGKLPVGGNKVRVARVLQEMGKDLTGYDQAGEALPEPLRKCLVVMSLSARYAFGHDGNLVDFLDPLPLETKVLQDSLLSALMDVGKLSSDDIRLVHSKLIGLPNIYAERRSFRQSIKRVLLDCLLRSEIRVVPEQVMKVVTEIQHLARQERVSDRYAKVDSKVKVGLGDDGQIELEIEAILRISSHLQQIMFNWNEVLSERRSSKLHEVHNQFLLSDTVVEGNAAISKGTPDTAGRVVGEGVLQMKEEKLSTVVQDLRVNEVLHERAVDPRSAVNRDAPQVKEEPYVMVGGNMGLGLNIIEEQDIFCQSDRTPFHSRTAIKVKEEILALGLAEEDAEGRYSQIKNDAVGRTSRRAFSDVITVEAEPMTSNVQVSEDVGPWLAETLDMQLLTTIADEVATVGYTLVGRAMEKTLRLAGISLKKPVRNYLRSGLKRKAYSASGEGGSCEQHQITMILSIAEKIPNISHRALNNVRRRLEIDDCK